MSVKKSLKAFLRTESGASMVEYGMAILVISSIGVLGMTTLGGVSRSQVDTACATFSGTAC